MSELVEVSARTYSVEEYFEIENHSEIRHEYEDGLLIPMPGETLNANEIAQNFITTLQRILRKNGFRMFGHDFRPITNCYSKQTNLNALLRSPKLFIFTSLSEAQKWKIVFISWCGIQPVHLPDSAISNEVLFISFIEDLTGRK